MPWIVRHIRSIMLVAGALTTTMIYAAISPEAALQSTFGETLSAPLAHLVVRNWGGLIALVGGMLLYAAFTPAARPMALLVAGVSKVTFIALVLQHGSRYLGALAGVAIAFDAVMVTLFAWYLVAERALRRSAATSPAGVS